MTSPASASSSSSAKLPVYQALEQSGPFICVAKLSDRWNVIHVKTKGEGVNIEAGDIDYDKVQGFAEKLAKELALPFFKDKKITLPPLVTLAKWCGKWAVVKTVEKTTSIVSTHEKKEEAQEAGNKLKEQNFIVSMDSVIKVPQIMTVMNMAVAFNAAKQGSENFWFSMILGEDTPKPAVGFMQPLIMADMEASTMAHLMGIDYNPDIGINQYNKYTDPTMSPAASSASQ